MRAGQGQVLELGFAAPAAAQCLDLLCLDLKYLQGDTVSGNRMLDYQAAFDVAGFGAQNLFGGRSWVSALSDWHIGELP